MAQRSARTALEEPAWSGPTRHPLGVGDVYVSGDVTAIVSDHGAVGAHISVSARGRYPTWDELASIKELAFPDVPMGMALPPFGDHVNIAETCLHLWEMGEGEWK